MWYLIVISNGWFIHTIYKNKHMCEKQLEITFLKTH